jgi:gluconate 2-dehydrogenase alpha chain
MTYNFVENDYKMMEYCMERALKIAKAMNPTLIGDASIRRGDYSSVPYQSTHCTGGTIMGTDPTTSVVNRELQSWDAHNLFILGTSTFPQQVAYAPTGPAGALAYHCASAIVSRYLKNPSPMVQA